MLSMLRNQKGAALISVYIAAVFMVTVSGAAYTKALYEMRQVEREADRIKSLAAAEAGIQAAMAQIANNAYTGFINTAALAEADFQNASGYSIDASYEVEIEYPDQADWVIVEATATVGNETRMLEGRIFLDSNLSKYLVYANTTTFNSGTDAQYGEPDYTDVYGDGVPDYPELVPSNEDDRAALYFTGTWGVTGNNVQLYGDAHAQNTITGNSSSEVHGDTYVSAFAQSSNGNVTNSGVSGGLGVGDGFSDDIDRNRSGSVTSADYPDYHDLTATGAGDAHKTETLTAISHSFYTTNNSIPGYVGSTTRDRYLKFESNAEGTQTVVKEYTTSSYSTLSATYTLPANAIVYVKGDIYAKGTIGGRVSVVSSDDIFLKDDITYSNGQTHADATHSTAFMAKDKLYFHDGDATLSGIMYAENTAGGTAFDASGGSTKSQLRMYGNRVMNGSTNLSLYPDRVYAYDSNLKYYRPPGIPVIPDLRIVREEEPEEVVV